MIKLFAIRSLISFVIKGANVVNIISVLKISTNKKVNIAKDIKKEVIPNFECLNAGLVDSLNMVSLVPPINIPIFVFAVYHYERSEAI